MRRRLLRETDVRVSWIVSTILRRHQTVLGSAPKTLRYDSPSTTSHEPMGGSRQHAHVRTNRCTSNAHARAHLVPTHNKHTSCLRHRKRALGEQQQLLLERPPCYASRCFAIDPCFCFMCTVDELRASLSLAMLHALPRPVNNPVARAAHMDISRRKMSRR